MSSEQPSRSGRRSRASASARSARADSSGEGGTTGQRRRSRAAGQEAVVRINPDGSARVPVERERGPRGWLTPIMEAAYTKLEPREQAAEYGDAVDVAAEALAVPADATDAEAPFKSRLQPGRGENVLAAVPQETWLDLLSEYKRRKATAITAREIAPGAAFAPLGPAIPGARNWAPLGPSVVLNGQAHGLPSVGGRVSGIAVAPGGQLVYAATANGGVFRSDDGGMSWRSMMDAFDQDPLHFASTSLACGAIAIDSVEPQRVYVGTGEGDTFAIFQNRITNALPAYRGIGPIRSDDGGQTWLAEPTATASPTLAGKAFFALAVDPGNRENVVGATSEGLYQRVPVAGGAATDGEWVRRRAGTHSSVVVATGGGTTRFFAAEWGRGVLHSTDGANWSAAGTGFPTANVGRISLAARPTDPEIVYAMVVNTKGALLGVFRLDGVGGAWQRVANPPDVLPTDAGGGSQGDYDLAIAVDPTDPNLIYLGGSYFADQQFWPASVWRCAVQPSGTGFRMNGSSIGPQAHADVHVLVHTPDDRDALWVGCDGGIFLNRAPRGTGTFQSRNAGLACLCPTFFAQHPTDPGILFCGLQDNGTARTSGGPIWEHVSWGDGGYCLINWADPKQVLVFANGTVFRATDGGLGHNSWTPTEFPWAAMTEPIVGPPHNPDRPADAKTVALGAGRIAHISTDFGASWATEITIQTTGVIYALTFASPTRFFVGTTRGEVFRANKSSSGWSIRRLDNVADGPLELHGLISDIGIDWSDANLESIYLSFGGTGDFRHVWHYDGARWTAASGAPGSLTNLLDVEHNALAVDRQAPDNIYVGADIGVWHSADRGQHWQPLPNGLPDAPVFDLQIHPTRRLLRAATHGRGMYEFTLDP